MIFSATESAFLSINKLRLRVLRGKKNKKALRTGSLLDSKTKLLNTILLGNNLVNVGLTALLTAIALEMYGERGVEIAAIFSTVVLLLFGEITPKTIASSYPEKIAFAVAPFISFLTKLFAPVVSFLGKISELIARLFGVNTASKSVSFTEEDIKTFIDAGEEEGVIEQNEKKMLRQVFKFTDLTAKEIMVPRTEIVAIPLESTYQEILDLAENTSFSRFPVYKDGIDDICGFVYLKDMLFFDDVESFSVKKVMRPPLFILENRRISSIRKIFKENKQSIAIIVDEYSGTSGLVTIENLTREIFGSAGKEQSLDEDEKLTEISEDSFIVDGSMRLVELSEKLGIELKSEFYDTVGGFITEKLGDMPQAGSEVKFDFGKMTVQTLDGHRVESVLVSLKTEAEGEK